MLCCNKSDLTDMAIRCQLDITYNDEYVPSGPCGNCSRTLNYLCWASQQNTERCVYSASLVIVLHASYTINPGFLLVCSPSGAYFASRVRDAVVQLVSLAESAMLFLLVHSATLLYWLYLHRKARNHPLEPQSGSPKRKCAFVQHCKNRLPRRNSIYFASALPKLL